jgi:Tfp pilus assembly protein PilP
MRQHSYKKIFSIPRLRFAKNGSGFETLFVPLMTLVLNTSGTILAASKAYPKDLPRVGDGSKPSSNKKGSTSVKNHRSNSNSDLKSEVLDSSVTSEAELQGWSSFVDSSEESTAKEITKGVRVEDIVEPPSDYHYASFGKPDPFVPPLLPPAPAPDKGAGPSSLEVPIVSALQRYSIDNLLIVGIWQHSNGDRKALILTPSGSDQGGQGVIVRAGDPIGNRGGKILAIANDFIAVREFFLAPDGIRQYEDRRMLMTITPPERQPAHLLFKPGERVPKEVTDGKDVNLDDAGLAIPKPEKTALQRMTTNSQPTQGMRIPTAMLQRNGTAEAPQGMLSNGGGFPISNPSGQSPGVIPTKAPSPDQNTTDPASLSPPATAPATGQSPVPDKSNLEAPSGPNGMTSAPPNGEQLGVPPINGMPPNYINGVVGGVGRDISQPASNSIPTQ